MLSELVIKLLASAVLLVFGYRGGDKILDDTAEVLKNHVTGRSIEAPSTKKRHFRDFATGS
jgi:hypothetical protein